MRKVPLVYWSFVFTFVVCVVAGLRIHSLSGKIDILESRCEFDEKEIYRLQKKVTQIPTDPIEKLCRELKHARFGE